MEKKEILTILDNYNFNDESIKKAFFLLGGYLIDLKEDVKYVKDTIINLEEVNIINGTDLKTPTKIKRNDFYQMIHNEVIKLESDINNAKESLEDLQKSKKEKKSFKEYLTDFGWWIDSLYKIAVPILFILSYLWYTSLKEITDHIKNGLPNLP